MSRQTIVAGERVDMMNSQIATLDRQLAADDERLILIEPDGVAAARIASLALERAHEAAALVRDDFRSEIVHQLDDLRFPPGSARLTLALRSVLDQLAERLLVENSGFFVEVRGAARTGAGPYADMLLGERRAGAIRDYLCREHGLPPHRVATVSFGSAAGPGSAVAVHAVSGSDLPVSILVMR